MIDSSFNKVYFETGICQFLQIEGISNFTVNKTTSFDNPYVIGGQISASQVNSPTKIDVSFDRSFIQKDFIFNYIQSNPLRSIYIQQENCYYKISNLYLTSYSASFGVGELPKISSKFSSYYNSFEERDSLEGTNLNLYTYQLDIPKLNSIILTDMSNTIVDDTRNPLIKNQIVSNFDFSMTMKRQPYYTIGCKLPNEVVSSFPNDVNFSITTKKLQYSLKEIDNTMDDIAPCCNLNFNIYISGCELMKFPITNSKLVSRENTFQSCSLMNIRKNYIGYYDLN